MAELKQVATTMRNYTSPISSSNIHLKEFIVPIILAVSDYIAVLIAIWSAYSIRVYLVPIFLPLPPLQVLPNVYHYLAIPLAVIFFMHFDKMYVRRLLLWNQIEKVFKVSIYAILLILTILYITEEAKYTSRLFLGLIWIFCFIGLSTSRYLVKKILIAIDMWQIPVVIVGAGKTGELLFNVFQQDSGMGYKVIGLIEDRPLVANTFKGIPVIGTFATAEKAIQHLNIKNVIVAAPGLAREDLVSLIYRLQPYVKNITFVPDLFGIPVGAIELDTLFYEKTILLTVRNNLTRWYNRVLKRIFDVVATLVGGLIISPLFAVISILIYLDSTGPIIFAHKRVGENGGTFPCYKFRTMIPNAQEVLEKYLAESPEGRIEWEQDYKLKEDPRITKIGHFLRRTSLDELPQLLNVIRGEMSLVGPRPIIHDEIKKYGDYISDYYLVRPGMTGLWQVSGRNDVDYDTRVRMDSWYVRNWSLWLDIVMIFKTIRVVLGRQGAY